MLTSVIIPCYNAEDFVADTIESVLAQDGGTVSGGGRSATGDDRSSGTRRVEVIAVDDGSTDGTLAVLERYADRIRIVQPGHHGGPHARNVGAAKTAGDRLVFLDADDMLTPGTLQALADALEGQDKAISYCRWVYYTFSGADSPLAAKLSGDGRFSSADGPPAANLSRSGTARATESRTSPSDPDDRTKNQEPRTKNQWFQEPSDRAFPCPHGDPLSAWLYNWFVPPCAVMWTRQAFEATGGWDESLLANQDGDLMMRAFLQGIPLIQAGNGLALYRRHGEKKDAVSTNYSKASLQSRLNVLDKVAGLLDDEGRLDDYERPLGRAYYILAGVCRRQPCPELAESCLEKAEKHFRRGDLSVRTLAPVMGFEGVMRLHRQVRRFRRGIARRLTRRG